MPVTLQAPVKCSNVSVVAAISHVCPRLTLQCIQLVLSNENLPYKGDGLISEHYYYRVSHLLLDWVGLG